MFRITRIRIRWINRNEPIPGAQGESWGLDQPRPGGEAVESSNARLLTTLDLPNARLRVRWLGIGSLKRPFLIAVVLLAALIIYSVIVPPNSDQTFDPDHGLLADLASADIQLGNETIRMIHSPLDIGSPKDVFDGNLDTLMRGRSANPFILDLMFPQPEAIRGFTMDMGRMDFKLRVTVYAPGSSEGVFYEGEYRNQPAIPHVDLDFGKGPGQVRRIHIEIEQIDPPNEVHVHVREVVLKK